MTCFAPLRGYRSQERNLATGKHGVTFIPTKALIQGSSLMLPCGQCIGCRTQRAKEWSVRCAHEVRMHAESCFVTLTYDDQNVPRDFSVKMRHWQLFTKRANKRFGGGLRYFGCGEYGEQGFRPHYHGLLFGVDFADKRKWMDRNGYPVFKSETLAELWPFGHHELGSATAQSAGYIARYCLKKITGDRADDHYSRVSPIDGEVHRVDPEFCTMSKRPGIGASWFDAYASDAFPMETVVRDGVATVRPADGAFVVVDGRRVPPPKFYLRRLEERAQELVKRRRKRFAVQPAQKANATPARLKVREEVFASRLKQLKRSL